jgi:hypothetical protein
MANPLWQLLMGQHGGQAMANPNAMGGVPYQEDELVRRTLLRNRDKDFVRRILSPSDYPRLDAGNGQVMTHRMSWAEVDGRPIVYPTVVYDRRKKKLTELSDDAALDYALQNGEFISFQTPAQAAMFSEKYKRGSPGGMR